MSDTAPLSSPPRERPRRLLDRSRALRFARALSLLVATVGAVVILGWILGLEWLQIFWPGNGHMVFNAAVCLFVCGVTLYLGYLAEPRAWHRVFRLVLGGFV